MSASLSPSSSHALVLGLDVDSHSLASQSCDGSGNGRISVARMEAPAMAGVVIHLVSDLRPPGWHCVVSCDARHLPLMWGGEARESRGESETPLLQKRSLLLPTVDGPGVHGGPYAMGLCRA